MSEIKAEKLLEEYDAEKLERIHSELESLKPWRYTIYLELAVKMTLLVYINWFVEADSFLLDSKFLLILILVVTGSSCRVTDRIHKRIDVLIKLYNSKPPFKAKNT